MLLQIPGILNQAQLEKINGILGRAEFVDGKLTAGKAARRVKHNQELKREPQQLELLTRILVSSLSHNQRFNRATLPYRMADPIFARYQPGMAYGEHVDDPLMGGAQPRFRSDISMTVFLRDPGSYKGGELVIRTAFGEQQVKLSAGDAVIYPSSSLHRVAEVLSGERYVVLLWIQSLVRDPAQRELLFELNEAREQMLQQDPESESTRLVDKTFANLFRMWSEI